MCSAYFALCTTEEGARGRWEREVGDREGDKGGSREVRGRRMGTKEGKGKGRQ